jgi:hypothetical protein
MGAERQPRRARREHLMVAGSLSFALLAGIGLLNEHRQLINAVTAAHSQVRVLEEVTVNPPARLWPEPSSAGAPAMTLLSRETGRVLCAVTTTVPLPKAVDRWYLIEMQGRPLYAQAADLSPSPHEPPAC